MGKVLLTCCGALLASASVVAAQQAPERARVEWISGVLLSGSIADAEFQADFSTFGGALIRRDGGTLDVDPSMWYGFRGTYRLNDRISLGATWMHSRGRFRVQFPANASVSGNFDLEGLLLAGDDFTQGGAEQAMSDALTDVYMISGSFDFPVMERWAIPYITLGTGIYSQRSTDNVIDFEYEGDLPAFVESLENLGISQAELFGLSVFKIDETNPMVSIGGGVRVGLGQKWGVNLRVEDLIRFNVNNVLQVVNEDGVQEGVGSTSTPPPDPDAFRVYSTKFNSVDGLVHNWGIQLSVNYSLWPYQQPR